MWFGLGVRLKFKLELGKIKPLFPFLKTHAVCSNFSRISLAFGFMEKGIVYLFIYKYGQKTV